jgi:PHD/YefM family antitoxin component YafN of YafNO toxin-antitoxin module
MSERTLSISEAQKELTRLPDEFEEGLEAITVTRYGKPIMAVLPFSAYESLLGTLESLQETLEVLQDKDLMTAFRESMKALQDGETVDWEDAKRELELS